MENKVYIVEKCDNGEYFAFSSDAKAKDKITKIDKQRASYYNYYTSKRWGEVDSYDLCLNSSVFGIDGTVDMIKQAIEVKEAGIRKIFSI